MPLSHVAIVTLTILLFEHCTTVTLTRFTQQRTDMPRANPTVVVMFTEMLKMVLALWLECTDSFGLGTKSSMSAIIDRVRTAPIDTLKVSVPAFLYTIQNISIFVALGNLEVVTFQVLYQMKLMLTAVLSVLFLGRRLSSRQWTSLVMLTVGVIAVELSDASLKSAATGKKADGRRLDVQLPHPHSRPQQQHGPILAQPPMAQPRMAQPLMAQSRSGCTPALSTIRGVSPALHAATLAPSGEPLGNLWSVADALQSAEVAEAQVVSALMCAKGGRAAAAAAAAADTDADADADAGPVAKRDDDDGFIRISSSTTAVERTSGGSSGSSRQGPSKWPDGGRRMTANDHTGRELSDATRRRSSRELTESTHGRDLKAHRGGHEKKPHNKGGAPAPTGESSGVASGGNAHASSLPEKSPLFGLCAALLAATLSSFAGVYFEGLVKGKEAKPPSLWMRNVQLALFTIPLASLAVLGQAEKVADKGMLYGIDAPTLLLIALNASGGLLVAAVIKHGDNILKNFTTSCSVILGTLISVVLFDFKLSLQFGWGSALVVCSAYAYATAPAPEETYRSVVESPRASIPSDETDDAEAGALTPIKA